MYRFAALGISILLFCAPALSATFFVEKPKATGLSEGEAETLQELVIHEIPVHGGNTVVGRAADADSVIQPKAMRLGKSYLVILTKTDRTGKLRYSSQLKATSVEEFDTVTARLVRAVIAEVPVKEDTQVGEVTEHEAKGTSQRREASKYWFVGFGPFALIGLGSEGASYGLTIGYDWDIESTAAVKIFWDGVFNPNGASFNTFGLGGSYFFTEKKNAPLVSVDFGYGSAEKPGGADAGGFALGAGPGIRFFRTSKINVEVHARFGILLRTLGGSTPSMLGLHAALLF